MARKNNPIIPILGAALGTGLAVYGVQRGLRWYRQRQAVRRYDAEIPERSYVTEGRFAPLEQPIPTTGVAAPMTAAPPGVRSLDDMSTSERVNSDRVGDFDDRGTSFFASEMTSTETDRLMGEADETAGRMTRANTHGDDAEIRPAEDTAGTLGVSPEDTGESWAGPGTGIGADVGAGTKTGMDYGTGADMGSARQYPAGREPGMGQSKSIVMDEVVAPLIEHAIAFHSVMNLLRSRQRDGMGNEGIESLTEGDRHSMRAVLDQMQERVTAYDEAAMRRSPLAHRSYKLTARLRDALDNLQYTGADLYRIHEEIKSELCVLARELENSGQVTITGLDQVRQLYEC